MTASEPPDWKVYERVIASFEVDHADMDTSVTPNARLIGSLSGVERQIDVLVDTRWEEGVSRRIIFDAKLRKRKINVKDVEAFEGMMRDVCAERGVIVCSAGYSKAALARAQQNIAIRIISAEEAAELDHGAVDLCPHCADNNAQGVVFWDGQFPLPLGLGWAIIFTGKCDTCYNFAFWCWDCGDQKLVPNDIVHECGCERSWFAETTEDEILFIVRTDEGEVPLDRRPLR